MVSKEQLQEIAKRAGIEAEALISAIASDADVKLDLPKVHVYTDDELITFKNNVTKEAYERGKEAGVEMKFKEIRDHFQIDIEGKDFSKLMEKHAERVLLEAKAEPNKKITELTNDLKKIQDTLKEVEANKEREVQELKAKMAFTKAEAAIKSMLPDSAGDLDREDLYLLYTGKRKVNVNDNGFEIIDLKTNEILKDKMQNPVSIEDDIKSFLEMRKIATPGRGGSDDTRFRNGVDGLKSRSEVEQYVEKNNIPLSERASILQKAMKNEGFDMAR